MIRGVLLGQPVLLGALSGERGLVREVVDVACTVIRRKTISNPNRHQRVLLEVLLEKGESPMGELKAAYKDRVSEPQTERTLRKYLTKIAHYDLVEFDGDRSGRLYRPHPTLDADDLKIDDDQIVGPTYGSRFRKNQRG